MLMNLPRFHDPALLMKLGGDPELADDPSLGEAISHVMQQSTDERWLFDIVTDDGLLTYTIIQKIALSPEFESWKQGGANGGAQSKAAAG
jgi:hypothetical protein